MIDIKLSNRNSQGIQKILEEQQEDLQAFLRVSILDSVRGVKAAQQLVGLALSEHFNIARADS